jgi:hypothetical protein
MNGKKAIAAVIGDVHYRTTTPEYRKETCAFNRVIERKMETVFAFCIEAGIPLFIAGDLFDKSRNFTDCYTFMRWLKNTPHPPVYAVPGQHDMFHHDSNAEATSFNMARFDGNFVPFGSLGTVCLSSHYSHYAACGCGWGEAPAPCGDLTGILITHRSLWHKKPVYPGQTQGNVETEAAKFAALGYRAVFSGDNHRAFDVKIGGVAIHNCGAFTRNSVDLAAQRPRFLVLYDDLSVNSVYVGEEDVFDMERSDADKGRVESKETFSEALIGGFTSGAKFREFLLAVADSGKCGEAELNMRQRDMLREVVNSIGNRKGEEV